LKSLYRRLDKEVDPSVRLYQAKKDAEAPVIESRNFAAKANDYIRRLGQEDKGKALLDAFLESRPISMAAIRNFGVGFDPDRDALSFPYGDEHGRVTGIKYRYPNGFKASETGSHYGLYGVKDVIGSDRVIVCEGESDTLSAWSAYGRDFAVGGTSGASVSEAQWSSIASKLLFASRVYLAYDADDAGDRCAATAMRVLGDYKCVRLRPSRGNDISEHIANGGNLEELGLV